MRIPGIRSYIQAHGTNFTQGRNRALRKFNVHHTAGWEDSLGLLWGDAERNGSSSFFVAPGYYEQYVDTNDTPWTNGNFASNSESLTCETRGDWRGYHNQPTLDTLAELMYQCLKVYPHLTLEYHMDVSDKTTLCPADLKHKGYALACWNKAQNRLKVEKEASAPKAPVSLRIDIPDKKVVLIRDTNLWDMSFTSFNTARAIKALPKGTVIDVAGIYDHPLSKVDYYLSNYSWNAGQNWGISKADCVDFEAPASQPKPTPEPTTTTTTSTTTVVSQPPVVESGPKGGAGTLPPVPVDPNGEKLNQIWLAVRWIQNLLAKIFNGGEL